MSILLALLAGVAVAGLILYLADDGIAAVRQWYKALRSAGTSRVPVKLPSGLRRIFHARRLAQVRTHLPQALSAMGTSVRAGLSLTQALDAAAKRVPEPLGGELKAIAEESAKGGTIDRALVSLEERLPVPEVQLMSACLRLARSTGGNLAPLLDQLTETIRERERMAGHVRALTAQGRLSAWIIGAMPFVLIGIMLIVDPAFIRPMFATPIGWMMLGVGAVLEALGVFVLNMIVRVEP